MSQSRGHFTTILDTARLSSEKRTEQDFALVLNAPTAISEALDDVRRRYDPAFKAGIPPHITVKRPAPLGGMEKLPLLQQVLREGLKDTPPIQVQLLGYGTFKNPGSSVVFLKVQDEQPFCQLHSQAISALAQLYPNGLADHYEGNNYHPHLTIGNELNDLDLAVLEYELSSGSYQLDFAFTIDYVTLFVHQPGQPWEAVENLSFLK